MNRSTKTSLVKLMAGAAALTLTLAACGSEDDPAPAAGQDTASPTEATGDGSTTPADETFAAAECTDKQSADNAFRIGGILPLSGNLAFLAPPEIAGIGVAVNEINAAGGVAGVDACYDIQDSGDSTDMSTSTAAAGALVRTNPSVVIGAASSSVSLNVVDTFTDERITQVSAANTASAMSGVSPFYFRTAPDDTVQGKVLGETIAQDGYSKLAFLVFSDTYGTGLRDTVQQNFEASGGTCTYGCKGEGDEWPAGQTIFSSDVTAALASKPDVIAIIAFDETKSILPELEAQGWDMSKTYFVDGNLNDYSADVEKGALEGAVGTLPGADPAQSYKDRANGWYQAIEGEELTGYSYSAEAYDAVMLSALAAIKGGDTRSQTVQKNFLAVSGATDGTQCTTFAECVALLEQGEEIHYAGPSGIGPLNDAHDPSRGFVGIYAFNAENQPEYQTVVEADSTSSAN